MAPRSIVGFVLFMCRSGQEYQVQVIVHLPTLEPEYLMHDLGMLRIDATYTTGSLVQTIPTVFGALFIPRM